MIYRTQGSMSVECCQLIRGKKTMEVDWTRQQNATDVHPNSGNVLDSWVGGGGQYLKKH